MYHKGERRVSRLRASLGQGKMCSVSALLLPFMLISLQFYSTSFSAPKNDPMKCKSSKTERREQNLSVGTFI